MNRWLTVIILALAAAPTQARTIELGISDMDGFAAISPLAPNMGIAGYSYGVNFHAFSIILVDPNHSALVRYPLSRIPSGMKITNAQWVLPRDSANTPEVRIHVWRLLGDWGPGVCYLYRTTEPEAVSWYEPGAGGVGTDRAVEPTVVVSAGEAGREIMINVTQDVALWYSGAAPNHGWLLTTEQASASVNLRSPTWTGIEEWKLRITYEPQ